MLEHRRATIWNQSNCFSAKLSSSVCLKLEHRRASISVSRRSFRLQFDAPPRRFLGRTELPAAAQDRRHEALARAYEAGAMLVIVSIILVVAFAVTTRDCSSFPLARRRQLRRSTDSVCDKLTRQGTVQMQPSALPVDHYSWKPRSICSSGRACHPHACCACP